MTEPKTPQQMIPQGYPLWLIQEDYAGEPPGTYLAASVCHLVIGWVAGMDPEGPHWSPVLAVDGGLAFLEDVDKPGAKIWSVSFFTTVPPVDGGRIRHRRHAPRRPPTEAEAEQ
ncbi:hypothetical protein EDD27_3600 [Nonomuraea polychroma]|uniref:Uncharacterized protein n=1 Tax=Nonomuraea polychroma TaxID=46176 RepID=A0A438M620_9ACTN|nr:hypothetical protein [Nonomuraea polychroma]RVX41131.1 hypothetical protein EDD27_3600 [Nonomuraea polychroma]